MATAARSDAPRLFGRDRELAQIANRLTQAFDEAIPATIRVVGRSGLGKSALIGAACKLARGVGWIALETRCHPSQQRTPAAVLRRLIERGMRDFPFDRAQYLSGLELELQTSGEHVARYQQAVLRLLEGILLDYSLVLAVDDAQWLDSASAKALVELASNATVGRLVVIAGQRPELAAPFDDSFVTADVVLKPLPDDAARRVVLFHYPQASPVVVDAAVERGGGVPFDLVSLATRARDDGAATVAAVLESAKALIGESIEAADPALREYLQICSLVEEPIDPYFVDKLVGGRALARVAAAGARYLCSDDDGLRFTHALVADAVRATVEFPIILRRRILDALLAANGTSIADYDRVAQVAAQCNEPETEYRYLTLLARKAYSVEAFETAIAAFERALAIRTPDAAEYGAFFAEYGNALRITDRWDEARAAMERAVDGALERGFTGWGQAGGALVWATAMLGDVAQARRTYARLIERAREPADRLAMLSIGAALAMLCCEPAPMEEIRREIEAVGEPARRAFAIVLFTHARLKAQLGDEGGALHDLRRARGLVEPDDVLLKYALGVFGLQIELLQRGCAVSHELVPSMLREVRSDVSRSTRLNVLEVGTYSDFARGHFDDVAAKVEESSPETVRGRGHRSRALAMSAAVAALTGKASPYETAIDDVVDAAIARGWASQALQVGFWRAAYLETVQRGGGERIGQALEPFLDEPAYATTFFMPVSAAIYAARANNRALLERLASADAPVRASAWDRAHALLGTAVAQRALGRSATEELGRARDAFRELGASMLAAFAARLAGTADAKDRALLESLGVLDDLVGEAPRRSRATAGARKAAADSPTLREMQVAELVAEGYSNRRIAEALVLSERTVEAHLSNLFGKLGLSSRSALTRWVIDRRDGVVA